MNADQLEKARSAPGFIAALDQSGGSTPKALQLYGVAADAYANEAEMFDLVHKMRARIITDAAFQGEKILAAILFENTMEREIGGMPTAKYLWEQKNVIPILKVDKGLAEEADGAQMMKPNPGLEKLLERAGARGIFGTKMRSVIKLADARGIENVAAQQFETAETIIDHGLVPIIEPEVDIHSPQKAEAESLLREQLLARLAALGAERRVILKLTLPEQANFYAGCMEQPACLRVAALSGGYSREESCRRLAQNRGMIASFSRALTEGLSAAQSDSEFTATLAASIDAIAAASAS
ncbi:MAG: fructose bisphosphate aldolase [Gammaproteobacteria bacterium]|nr:fructose bisphosphate aldolase [Gammaproteobacteria bacterium]